jgi:4'-phosphopantetheinyl transferase EntD
MSAFVEMFSDVSTSTLFTVEASRVAAAVEERQREFATVRYCARLALDRIGVPAVPILPDADGVPRWPRGIVGSMTHCRGYRAAVVARSSRLGGIGIDAEPHESLPDAVREFVLRDEETASLGFLHAVRPEVHWGRIFFCAKEAAYKAWFPLARRWLEFTDIRVELSPEGTFVTRVFVRDTALDDAGSVRFRGRWVIRRGLVIAMAGLPRTSVIQAHHRDIDAGAGFAASAFGGRE